MLQPCRRIGKTNLPYAQTQWGDESALRRLIGEKDDIVAAVDSWKRKFDKESERPQKRRVIGLSASGTERGVDAKIFDAHSANVMQLERRCRRNAAYLEASRMQSTTEKYMG